MKEMKTKEENKKELLLNKINRLIAQSEKECTMSGNIDARRYLKRLKSWVNKNI